MICVGFRATCYESSTGDTKTRVFGESFKRRSLGSPRLGGGARGADARTVTVAG